MPRVQTPQRTVRVSDELWISRQAIAESRGESLSDAIRTFLEGYGQDAVQGDGAQLHAAMLKLCQDAERDRPEVLRRNFDGTVSSALVRADDIRAVLAAPPAC